MVPDPNGCVVPVCAADGARRRVGRGGEGGEGQQEQDESGCAGGHGSLKDDKAPSSRHGAGAFVTCWSMRLSTPSPPAQSDPRHASTP